jgi:hypothetical protein
MRQENHRLCEKNVIKRSIINEKDEILISLPLSLGRHTQVSPQKRGHIKEEIGRKAEEW